MKAVRRSLRKHLSPLGADSVSLQNLPPVRMGLLAKLNLLTIGLIFLTAVAVTTFQFTQQWRDEAVKLRTQGESLLAIIAELAASRVTERGTRADDKRTETAMEDRKRQGYF